MPNPIKPKRANSPKGDEANDKSALYGNTSRFAKEARGVQVTKPSPQRKRVKGKAFVGCRGEAPRPPEAQRRTVLPKASEQPEGL